MIEEDRPIEEILVEIRDGLTAADANRDDLLARRRAAWESARSQGISDSEIAKHSGVTVARLAQTLGRKPGKKKKEATA